MSTLTLSTGQISPITFVPAGSRVTLSGSGSVEWTPGNPTQAANQPDWQTWALGSTAGFQDTLRPLSIRVTATGSCTVTIEAGGADKYGADAYWEEDIPYFAKDSAGNVTGLVGAGETFKIFNERVCSLSSATQAIATATPTVIDFTSSILDTHSLADLAANTIANPFTAASETGYYKILGRVTFAASAAGTYRRVVVQQEVFAGVFAPLITNDVEPRASGDTVVNFVSPLGYLQNASGLISLRVTVEHDVGANLNVTSAFEFQFMN